MSQVNELRHIANWLRQLVQLCAPGKDPVNREKIATYSQFLQADFPLEAFTSDSLKTIAQGHEFFPPLSLLHKHLTVWWEGHRPPPPNLLLTGPLAEALEDIDRRMISSWMTNRPGYVAVNLLPASLHLLRANFPRAYRYIVNHDLEAAGIAVRRGWDDRSEDAARQAWQDPVAIRASVRLVLSSDVQQMHLGKMLGKAVATHAPQHLPHVPPEWHPI